MFEATARDVERAKMSMERGGGGGGYNGRGGGGDSCQQSKDLLKSVTLLRTIKLRRRR